MSRLIIYVTGKPNLHGHKRREFLWSPAHSLYLYGGKEIEADQFNAAYEKAMKNNADMNPRAKVVASIGVQAESPTSNSGGPAAVTNVTVAHETTVDEALAVLERLAPERLKKKPGRKPNEAVAMEVA